MEFQASNCLPKKWKASFEMESWSVDKARFSGISEIKKLVFS